MGVIPVFSALPSSAVDSATSVALMIRPDTSGSELRDMARMLGGGWATGVEAWQRSGMVYLLMIAAGRKRIARRAPLVMMVRDLDALPEGMRVACDALRGETCVWTILDHGPGGEAAQAMLAQEAEVAGNA